MKDKSSENIIYKIADQEEEFQQIHRLNYQTFVEEIPQHERNPDGILIDKLHEFNTYIIAKKEDEVIAMVSICSRRPFSLEGKLENLESYLPEAKSLCETRLLAVKKEYRGRAVFAGLAKLWYRYAKENGFDYTLSSGTLRQLKLYRHMGFVPFGPVVGTKDAPYQPMCLQTETLGEYLRKRLKEDV